MCSALKQPIKLSYQTMTKRRVISGSFTFRIKSEGPIRFTETSISGDVFSFDDRFRYIVNDVT